MSPDAATITRIRDGVVIEVNDRLSDLTGYPRDEIVGRSAAELLWVDPEERRRLVEEVEANGSVRDFPYSLRRKSGWIIEAEITAEPISYRGEQCLFAITQDVTERRVAERALRKSEARYRQVVEIQSEFIVRWLPDGTRTFVNEAYCRFFGGAKEELEGTSFYPLIDDADRAAVRARIAALTPERPVSTGRHRVRLPDGREGWQEWTDHALFDGDGNVLELQSVGRDVTDLVTTRTALEESRAHLSATLAAVPDLIVRHTTEGVVLAVHAENAEHLVVPGTRIGTHVGEVLPPEVARQWVAVATTVAESGELASYEYDLELDGEVHSFEARMVSSGPDEVLTMVRDITQVVRDREETERVRAMFRAAWDQSPVSIVVADPDGTLQFVNLAFLGALGLAPRDLAGRSFELLEEITDLRTPEGERVRISEFPIARAIRGEVVRAEEYVARLQKRPPQHVVVNAAPVYDADGSIIAAVSVAQDVTELRREVADRAAGERLFQAFFDHVAAGMVAIEFDQCIRMVNPAFARMLGLPAEELLGRKLFDLMTPVSRGRGRDLLKRLEQGVVDHSWGEEAFVRADGSPLAAFSSVTLVRDADGRPDFVIGLVQDLSDQRRLEGEVLEVAKQERERLGRDLHDGLGQELTATALLAVALERALEPDHPTAAARAKEIREVAQAALSQTRFLAKGLLPAPLKGGIGVALADLAANATDFFGVEIRLDIPDPEAVSEQEAARHLYHICREAVTNAVRHGGATVIDVQLAARQDSVTLRVRDNGSGFSGTPAPRGLGLRNMRFRAGQMGGDLKIRGVPGEGATITCTIDRGVAEGHE